MEQICSDSLKNGTVTSLRVLACSESASQLCVGTDLSINCPGKITLKPLLGNFYDLEYGYMNSNLADSAG